MVLPPRLDNLCVCRCSLCCASGWAEEPLTSQVAEREEDEAKVLRLAMEEEEDLGKFEDEKFAVESEVDWGGSGSESEEEEVEEEEAPASGPLEAYPAPPPLKKQRLTSKGPLTLYSPLHDRRTPRTS